MQILLPTEKIYEEQKKEQFLDIISDRYCRSILDTIQDIPKSVTEIADEKKIPISTVYRRIQALHDIGILQVTGNISEDGKKFFLYKSKVVTIQSKFSDGKIEVWICHNQI